MNSKNSSEILLYKTPDGQTRIDVRLLDETAWLNQSQMSSLFDKDVRTISEHISNIYQEEELSSDSTIRKFRIVQEEGSRNVARDIAHYNLEVILSVGYRVKSKRGTQFRQWATATLKEYLVKGFAMNDERLKDAKPWDYFDEFLERIREIRASEKRFYQKIRDIYANSVDYSGTSKHAILFFKTVQNKMLFAVTGKTAAELLLARANAKKPNMGLTNWKGSRVRKQDVAIAKNYLNHDEISELNRIVTMFLDFAEDQAKRRNSMKMQDWEERLNAFLKFNAREVLNHSGKVSHDQAEAFALNYYQQFDEARINAETLKAENEDLQESRSIEKRISSSNKSEST
jgi:hypothetical protein